MLSKQLSHVRRSIIGSMLSGGAGQFGLVISGILSSRILGPEDRGHLALLMLVPLVLCNIGGLGLPLAATYFAGKTPAAAGAIARLLVKPALIQVTFFGVVQTLILRAYVDGRPPSVKLAAIFCGLLLPSWLASEYGFALLQGQQRFGAFNLVRSWSKLLQACILLAFFVMGIGNLPVVAASWLAVSWLETAVALSVIARGLGREALPSSVPNLKQMAWFGITALPGAISPIETLRLDQVIVGLFFSPASVGIYVTAAALTNLPRYVAQSVGVIAYPYIAGLAHWAKAWRATWRFFWVALVISLAAAAAIAALTSTLIPLFFGDAFSEAVPVARILLFASAISSGRRVLADGARGLGYPELGTMAEMLSWCAMLAMVHYLLAQQGISGVATAIVVGSLLGLAVLVFGLAVRRRGVRLEVSQMANDEVASASRS